MTQQNSQVFDIQQPFVTQEQKFKYWTESKAEIRRLEQEVADLKSQPGIAEDPEYAEIKFNWVQSGDNCGEHVYKCEVLGHSAKLYKAYDNQLWSAIVDGVGTREIASEHLAMEHCESLITSKIKNKIDIANTMRKSIKAFTGK